MPDDAATTGIGATLREAREAQSRSIEDMALSLRARVFQLEALEQEDFEAFGGDVYAKGFLRNYAVELGLDPEPLLDIYRREVGHDDVHAASLVGGVSTPKERRGAPPAWIAWLLVAVVVVAGIAVLGSTDGRSPDQASPDDPPGPPPVSAEDDDDPDGDPTGDEGTGDGGGTDPEDTGDGDDEATDDDDDGSDGEEEPEFEGVDLLLAFEQASWVRVLVDDAPVFEQTVEAGETLPFEAENEVEIRFGNPGGVRATLNGEDLGPQGDPGQPVTVRYTPDGREDV
ncbi:MAG: helix-turn-helix domain-containing protein [Nitriliruptoraceae bacterium]